MKQGIQRLLGARQLLRAIVSQSASVYANQVIAFVIPWIVLTKTGSAVNAGLVAFSLGAAALLGTLLGGLVTDRIGGRKVSIIADALSLATALILAVTLFFDYFAMWLVIVSQILGIFFDGPGTVAKSTTIPAAAAEDKIPLVRALGVQQTLQNLAMFLGPVSAGTLIAVLTESWTLAFTSVLFLLAIYLVARLPRKVMIHEQPMSVRQAAADMKEAVVFVFQEPLLKGLQLFGPLYAFVLFPVSALIFPAWFVFAGQSSANLGIFLGAEAIGAAAGGFIFAALAPKVSQRAWLAVTTAGYAVSLFVLSFTQPGSVVAVAVAFIGGLAITGIFAIPYTAFYARTPERLLGRIGSFGAASGFLVIALAAPFFGWLINATSAETAIAICASVMGAIAIGVMVLPFMKLLDQMPAAEVPTTQSPNMPTGIPM